MTTLDMLFEKPVFDYVLLPLLIFVARIIDVTIGTIRIVMVSKGQKFWAPLLGFFEMLVWLIAISRIFENLDNWVCYFAFAAGFGMGNFIGLRIEEKLAMGIVKIQIITNTSAIKLINNLKTAGFGITHHNAKGATEEVSIIYSIIKRTQLSTIIDTIKATNPNAFYSIEDVKSVSRGIYPVKTASRGWRKGK